jgi:uncharacterized delta-60 repeat protein
VKRLATILGLALLALGPLGVSSAATAPLAGGLDASFGSGGVVTQTRGFVGALAVQADGKVVAAGDVAGDSLVARYLPDGSLDSSFGTGGYAETSLPQTAKFASAAAVAVQPDGKIVVAGTTGTLGTNVGPEFALLRYNPNGTLDTTFGTDGIAITVIPEPGHPYSNAVAAALAILPSGDILAAGSASWSDGDTFSSSFALARYTSAGVLDSTFGKDGVAQTAFAKANAQLAGIVVQADGKIVASGWGVGSGNGNNFNAILLARYRANGSLDSTFGTAGKATTAHALDYQGGPPTLQNGKIVVAGDDDAESPVVARYAANGRLDTTFGDHGFETVSGPLVASTPPAVVAQKDGAILLDLPGATGGTEAMDALVRLTPNGQPDPSFGTAGVALLPSSGSTSLELEADGKVLAGGGIDGSTIVRVLGGNNCVVPGLRGKTVTTARATLTTSHCSAGSVSRLYSNKVARGRVISTAPLRGGRLPGGTKVALVVSRGRR